MSGTNYCAECGAKLSSGAKYCTGCGTKRGTTKTSESEGFSSGRGGGIQKLADGSLICTGCGKYQHSGTDYCSDCASGWEDFAPRR